MANGDYEGDIGPLNEKIKAEFEARPDRAELKRKHNLEYGDHSISPGDLNNTSPVDKDDARNARLKANFESGRADVGNVSASNPDYNQAKESFRESLGMAAGPEFDGHVQNLHAWVNESFGSVAEFDKLAAAAEEALGVKGAAELALKLAGAHARKRR